MSSLIQFAYTHRRMVLFGLTLTFFSSYGQTFLISLYIPEIEAAFNLSNTALSALYASATMASAFTLPWLGRLLDYWSLRKFTIMVLVGYAVACLTLSLSINALVVMLGFFGLRLFGQGLMTHTSISVMARAFDTGRGKAISLATLGHPLGESVLPLTMAGLIALLGWRMSLQISALSLILIVTPLVLWLLRDQSAAVLHPANLSEAHAKPPRNPYLLLRHKVFWIIAPSVFCLGFLNTALFFFQFKLGIARGWSPTWIAGSLTIYAIVSAFAMLIAGPIVDRVKARRLFPYILGPYVLGLLLLATRSNALIYPVALSFIALSNGAGSTIRNALYAEIFGIAQIGTIRSLFTTVIVFSTALGPLSFGLLLDAGWDYGAIFLVSAVLMAVVFIWSFRLVGYQH